jgi:poly(hydroxyalkanoate) granule-associated protein
MTSSENAKSNKTKASPQSDSQTPPAQHVWLAGLGAIAKAQEQGSKAIEALVNDGLAFQRKSQAEAQQRLQEATERLRHMASDFGQQASGRVDKLEHLFEDRVAKALHRLGMPTLLDLEMLSDRVAQLEAQLAALHKAASKPQKAAPHPTKSTAATSTAAKSTAAKKTAAKASAPVKTAKAKPKAASSTPSKTRPKSA